MCVATKLCIIITVLLLEAMIDVMPKKTVVTNDSSTPDIQSKFLTPCVP